MLQPRPHRHSTRHDHAILISDSGPFISEIRLLLGSDEVKYLLMATTVDDAIRLIKSQGCYCAIIDSGLATGTGIQAVTRIRHELGWPELTIPIILITERSTMDTIRSAVLAGVDEVLSMPLAPKTLASRMLATRIQPRPFVSSAGYDGPCRRRRAPDGLVANGLRRMEDISPTQMRRLAREVHLHLVTYQATQRAIELLSPSMLHSGLDDLSDATAGLYESTFTLQDARISCLAMLCQTLAASPDDVRKDPTLLLSTLRDLLALLESRLNRAASRIQIQSRKTALKDLRAGSIAADHPV
jgi:DNA-binding response OmpR family regulator